MMLCDNPESYCFALFNVTSVTVNFINSQLDLLYLGWVLSLVYPTFLAIIILPLVIVGLLYLSSFLLYLYHHRHYVITVLQETLETRDPWVGGRYFISILWDAHGYIWHGYEVQGEANIPAEGGGIIVYYHGALPVDAYYLTSRMIIRKGRLLRSIGDKFLAKIPGWKTLLDAFKIKPGSISYCVEEVNAGHILTISPGGVREAQFSNHAYQLIWGKRTGFAKVALETNCPIIPMFTENLREAFRTFCWPRWFWIALYEKLRIPLAPVYGGFPVKLRTYLGAPIYPVPNETAEELALRAQEAVKVLVEKHQKLPGNILRALVARVYDRRKSD